MIDDEARTAVVAALEAADDCDHVMGQGCCHGCLADQILNALSPRDPDGMTLTEFLTARLDEDEAAAGVKGGVSLPEIDRARVLREVEAKRALLRDHGATDENECPGCHSYLDGTWAVGPGEQCPVLAVIATVYADHPDYLASPAPAATEAGVQP